MTEQETTERKGIPMRDVFLCVEGIAPRERKSKRHIVQLGDHHVDTTPEAVLPLAHGRLTGFREVTSAVLKLNYVEVKVEHGHRSKSCLLMDPRHIEYRITQKQRNEPVADVKPSAPPPVTPSPPAPEPVTVKPPMDEAEVDRRVAEAEAILTDPNCTDADIDRALAILAAE